MGTTGPHPTMFLSLLALVWLPICGKHGKINKPQSLRHKANSKRRWSQKSEIFDRKVFEEVACGWKDPLVRYTSCQIKFLSKMSQGWRNIFFGTRDLLISMYTNMYSEKSAYSHLNMAVINIG